MRDLFQHIDETASVAAVGSCGLFVDIDGTLAPIQPRPDMAAVPPDVRDSLEAVARRMSVAVLTGRSAADGKRMVGSDALLYVGNHGMEWIEGRQGVGRARGGALHRRYPRPRHRHRRPLL